MNIYNAGKVCVVSVAFREPYVSHSKRQKEFIEKSNPEVEFMYYRDVLPANGNIYTENIVEHFQKSLYGFKPHAIQRAIGEGYKKIIWLDPSVLPTVSITPLIKALDEHPVIVRTGDAPISKMTNQKAKDWFGVTEDEIKDVRHVGGTVYCFNFNSPAAVKVFSLWMSSEKNGIFGDQDSFMAGHWSDEACMALSLHKCEVPQYWCEEFGYQNQKELPL